MNPEYLDIPIFPLPNVTFFSHTYLPLHVFEPRYRLMVANCVAGDRMLGVSLLREGWQREYFGRPAICKTFGVGKIVDHDELDDGRANIILHGLYRVRLIEEFPTRPYRTGRVRVLEDPAIDRRRAQVIETMHELHKLSQRLRQLMPALRETIRGAWAAHPHPLIRVNHLASALVIDAYDRQSILEQDDPVRRIRLVQVQLRNIIHQLDLERARKEELIEED